jgi:[ribosomal protein S5]-alanine N-acetyltransferase
MGFAFPHGLRGELVVLRQFRPDDAPWITAACDSPGMARFVPALPSPYSTADAVAYVALSVREWQTGTGAAFAIESLQGEPLGAVDLSLSAGDPGLAGIGYWLRPEARGRGAATEAVRLVAGWAFGELGIDRISLITDPANTPSQRVAERAGFEREGLLRAWHPTPAGRRDSIMFSLLRSDWPDATE